MYEPNFTLTLPMLNKLGTIERLYGQLVSQKLMPSLALRLNQENQVLATHYSTSIEGNPLSPQDVTNIVLSDKIPTTKSEREVKNYFATINHLFILARNHEEISVEITEELHKLLMKDIMDDAGHLRDGSVFVGHKTETEIVVKHNPPFHSREEIARALTELYEWVDAKDEYHPLLKAGILHHQFAYIHPFFDGNGRMARILTTYFLLLANYEVAKYFIIDDFYDIDRHLYSDTLHTADKGDKTAWLEYFLEGIAQSLQGALGRINDLSRKSVDEVTGEKRVLVSAREEEVLQIVIDKKAIKSSDLEESFGVSRQQAHALLSSLVRKGLLDKFGKTKTSYYKLAKKQ